MTTKKILTVGLRLASSQSTYASFDSKTSLLDWDIVLFRPDIDKVMRTGDEDYQGKPCLTDASSFALKECCEHWRREIKQAVETGKTVLVFLAPLEEVYVATGQKEYAGSGRNARMNRMVSLYSNYVSIPAFIDPVRVQGSSMKLVARNAEVLASYWDQFGGDSSYEVILTGEKVPACLVTKNGDKTVGALYRGNASGGVLLLLPDIDFSRDDFFKRKSDKIVWTPAAEQFASRMIGAAVALDRALRAGGEVTPEPTWAADAQFVLPTEPDLRTQLLEAGTQVEQAQKRKETVGEALKAAGAFRALLYEKGKPLERAVIDAVRLFGFTANPYKDSGSEFDVVFESPEGRLLGEAEGRDNNVVNIDKLRQLTTNIHEDLQRDNVSSPAKGVLFGNGFRLFPLAERSDPFTEKCKNVAASMGVALVFTPDLFPPVQYLLGTKDEDYSLACRLAIINAVGRVKFPDPPAPAASNGEVVVEGST
jgi:hypothetical protein